MKHTGIRLWAICTVALASATWANAAHADTVWNWRYSGSGIDASGTLRTADAADANGFYQILAISGSRNGDLITGLIPTGTAIPGNEPYAVDNLIKIGSAGQISVEGFGYALASGGYANPYFADFLSPPSYSEVFTQGPAFSEQAVTFSATPVPEPSSTALLMTGLGAVVVTRLLKRRNAEHGASLNYCARALGFPPISTTHAS